jgi:hypothetical protein
MNAVSSQAILGLCLVTVGHTQVRHPIERGAAHQQLGRLAIEAAGRHFVPENDLLAEHGSFSQAAAVVARLLFPGRTPDLADAAQVLIAHQPFGFAIAVLPNPGVALRGDRRGRVPRANAVITIAFVIGPIAGNLRDLIFHLVEQVGQDLAVAVIVRGDDRGDNFTRRFVHAQMQLAPGAPVGVAVLAHFPLAFAKDFDARAIHHHVQGLPTPLARQADFQRLAAATQLRKRGYRQRQAQQFKDGQHQAARAAQRQVIDLLQRTHRQNRQVGVSLGMAALPRAFRLAPGLQHFITDPERQTSTALQGRVILFPIAEAVGWFGFLVFHTSSLPTNLPLLHLCNKVLQSRALQPCGGYGRAA